MTTVSRCWPTTILKQKSRAASRRTRRGKSREGGSRRPSEHRRVKEYRRITKRLAAQIL